VNLIRTPASRLHFFHHSHPRISILDAKMRTRSGRGVGGTSNEEVFEQTGTPSRKRNREEDDIEVEDARGSPKRRTNAWAQTSKYALENCKLLELQLDPCWRCKLDKKQVSTESSHAPRSFANRSCSATINRPVRIAKTQQDPISDAD